MENENIDIVRQKELVKLLGLDRKTIFRAIKSERLKATKEGRKNLIFKISALEWWNKYYADKADNEKNLKIRQVLGANDEEMVKDFAKGRLQTNEKDDIITEDGNLACDVIESAEYYSSEEADSNSMEHKHEDKDPFKDYITALDWNTDSEGIYIISDSRKFYIANFTDVQFLYNRNSDKGRERVISIDNIKFELTPRDFLSQNNFNQTTLAKSKFRSVMDKYMFQKFRDIILELDNGKILENTTGIGRVHSQIFNLGNKMVVSGKLQDPEEVIWLDNTGYHIKLSDKIHIAENGFSFNQIWNRFYKLYGMKAVLLMGFAIATLFFSQLLELNGFFPILYITGDSGRGKSCLAELILQLFGLDTTFGSINVSSNATKVGIEIKSMFLKNLPLAIHEHNKDHLDMIKYRYDGQGSVKYDQNSSDNLNQLQVEGSTIITTVERPLDKQFNSRCVIIDLDEIKMNKPYYDKIRKETDKLSGFVLEVLEKLSLDDIIYEVEKMAEEVEYDGYMPRIKNNYCLFAGASLAFLDKLDNNEIIPSRNEIIKYMQFEINKAEKKLNPLIYFIREVERIWELPTSKKFITEDEKCLFFNFNSVWRNIPDSYKKKYFPSLSSNNIIKQLKDSKYMARYGDEIVTKKKADHSLPITNYPKTISGKTRRCYVLRKDKLPGYFC